MLNRKTIVALATGIVLLSLNLADKKDFFEKYELTKEYVSIDGGEVTIGELKTTVESFVISKMEVSNRQFNEFLTYLKENGQTELYEKVNFKNELWSEIGTPQMAEHYHVYKGFQEFPAVNVSREGAEAYLQWLTDEFKKVNKTDNEVVFRLPTKAEWIRAARGNDHNHTYAWGSPYLRNAEGLYNCNFKRIGAENIYFDEETNSYQVLQQQDKPEVFITSYVGDYPANQFGIKNLNGNVAEMVADEDVAMGGSWNDTGYDVRIESTRKFEKASPFVGFRPVMVVKSVKK
ncbi:MAG: SUMF1/EgtB/PvdO family nonheme iron enzyme [Bacteroidota bacterium]